MQINDHRVPKTCPFKKTGAVAAQGKGRPGRRAAGLISLQNRFSGKERSSPPPPHTSQEDQQRRAGPSPAVTWRVCPRSPGGAEGRGRQTSPGRRRSPSIARAASLCSSSSSSFLVSPPFTSPSSSSSREAAFRGCGRPF